MVKMLGGATRIKKEKDFCCRISGLSSVAVDIEFTYWITLQICSISLTSLH